MEVADAVPPEPQPCAGAPASGGPEVRRIVTAAVMVVLPVLLGASDAARAAAPAAVVNCVAAGATAVSVAPRLTHGIGRDAGNSIRDGLRDAGSSISLGFAVLAAAVFFRPPR